MEDKIENKRGIHMKFNVGDIVTGNIYNTYGITNDKMLGIVTSVNKKEKNFSLIVLMHLHPKHNGDSFNDLDADKFDTVRIWEWCEAHNIDLDYYIKKNDGFIDKDILDKLLLLNKDSKERKESKYIEKIKSIKDVESLQKLNAMDGLHNVKKAINEIVSHTIVAKKRKEMGLKNDGHSLHMVFKGNAGTGKTTIARMIGEIMHEIGFFKGHDKKEIPFVELNPADVKSKFVGAAEREMVNSFERAIGGVLFIDEFYSLGQGNADSGQGDSVISTLLKEAEDKRDKVIVIIAGYGNEMEDMLDTNSGLRSRFTNVIEFDDYTSEELLKIANSMSKDKDYTLDKKFVKKMNECLEFEKKLKNFGNARTVRNILEKAIRKQSIRVSEIESPTKEDLMLLTVEDLDYNEEYTKKLIERERLAESEKIRKKMKEELTLSKWKSEIAIGKE